MLMDYSPLSLIKNLTNLPNIIENYSIEYFNDFKTQHHQLNEIRYSSIIMNETLSNESSSPQAIYEDIPDINIYNKNKYFDATTNQELSDTTGDLKGTVYLAQSSLFPAINRIEGDTQPRLVSGRKTLLMFKPQMCLDYDSKMTLSIYDKDKNLLVTQEMHPPSELPQLANDAIQKTNIRPKDFSGPWNLNLKIKNETAQFVNMFNPLEKKFNNKNYIQLEFNNESNITPLILASNKKLANMHIKVKNRMNRDIKIYYSKNSITLNKGSSIKLICDENGHWVTKSDALISKYYSLKPKKSELFIKQKNSVLTPALSVPMRYDLTINKNDEISKIAKENGYLSKLIKENNSIKIETSDGNWARFFTLRANNHFYKKKMTFNSKATLDSYIRYGNKQYKLTKGESITFVYDPNKKWLPITEQASPEPVANLSYTKNTWSASISQEHIKPGIQFIFNTSDTKGVLSNIPIGAPNKILINTIDIGMLTPPRNEFDFQSHPELHRQYFQTIPAEKLIVAQYEPVHLTEVVMPNGDVFTEKATGNGGGHSGTMRHQIGKDLISDGINLANYGINSTAAEFSFIPSFQVTVHNSIGVYENGEQVHGWSGGAGKVTLYNSRGNELSHELGHNFGLGDYYGGTEGGTHAPADKKNSSWLWDADYNFFIPNLTKEGKFNTDAMSGGSPYDDRYNAYTMYTPNSLAAIQKRLENSYVFSAKSKTGYQKWDPITQKMEDVPLDLSAFYFFNYQVHNGETFTIEKFNKLINKHKYIHINSGNGYHSPNLYIPAASQENNGAVIKISSLALWQSKIHVNDDIELISNNETNTYISDGYKWVKSASHIITKKPYKQGVPIVSLTGFYDPEGKIEKQSCIPIYGSYGMVYQPDTQIGAYAPYIEVILQNGKIHKYQLSDVRKSKDVMNKFHINIEKALNPIKANIYVHNKLVHTQHIDIKPNKLATTVNGYII
ncbi:M66 family metalloprotease [Providencia vermicola]|uniref:M66 family metalloprotease n=1 Tax=Providencia vermicola TaxID=333965 RepID=UPI0032DAA5C6